MGEEREVLVKHVSPELHRLCETRGITWSEVDLRWGIPAEETRDGQLLETCFREIDRCRPFFIGILGERYGSVADVLPADLVDRLPWLGRYRGRSYTELEIRYALLDAGAAPMDARFYFRERPRGDAGAVDPRLVALKEEIEAGGSPVRRYASWQEFGALVLHDWMQLLDERFPNPVPATPDERERAAHGDYLRRRTTLFVPERGAMDRLDRLVRRGGPPLLVRGEAGTGKSSLVANWLSGFAVEPQSRPQSLLSTLLGGIGRKPASVGTALVYSVGAAGSSREWPAIVRFLTREAMRANTALETLPEDPEALLTAFLGELRKLAAGGRVLLVIDGIDQVAEPSSSSPLAWLPDSFPEHVRVVATLRPGPACDTLVARGWNLLSLAGLSIQARRTIARQFLASYGKRLPGVLLDRIAGAGQAAVPLYLRTLLEELRVFGSHEALSSRLDLCLRSATPLELFDMVLARLEADHGDPPGLVGESLALLASARLGLTEEDLLILLGAASAPLPRARWAPLRAALDEFLLETGGRISLFHETLTEVVRRRYLADPARRVQVGRRIITHFRERGGPQAIEEIPWQLAAAGDWAGLFDWLAEPSFLQAAWSVDPGQVKRYWALVTEHSGHRPPDAYEAVVRDPGRYPGAAPVVALLLRETAFPTDALRITGELVHRHRQDGDVEALRGALSASALVLRRLHRLAEALGSLKEEEALCRGLGDLAGLQANLGNQGVVLRELGRLAEALEHHREEERICEQLDDGTGIAMSWLNQAAVHLRLENWDASGTLLDRSERSFARLGDALGTQAALEVRGRLLARRRDRKGALACHERQERVCREVMYGPGIRNSLLYQAQMWQELLDLDKAVILLDRHARLCEEAGDAVSLSRGLLLRAAVFANARLLPQAMGFARDAARLAAEAGDPELAGTAERLVAQWAEEPSG